MALVVYEKPAHFKCNHKSALSIPEIPTVLPGFPPYYLDSHQIPGIPTRFSGFRSYSQGFGILGIRRFPHVYGHNAVSLSCLFLEAATFRLFGTEPSVNDRSTRQSK